jgi:hypothetical protein
VRVRVRYPSGSSAVLTGDFWGPGWIGDEQVGGVWHRATMDDGWPAGLTDDAKAVAMVVEKTSAITGRVVGPGSVVMLDPRAVCEDMATGRRLFAPSIDTPGTCQWVVDWLREHPDWPPMPRYRG